jgi:energy-coupling factor transport system ATP-binding protein
VSAVLGSGVSEVVSLRGVSYRYPGATTDALAGVDLVLGPGELVVLAGASGSGKSTLLGAISGLVPHFHGGTFAGHVEVVGRDTREHGPGQLARDVGTLFQDPETQVVMGTVAAELAFPLENRGATAGAVARGVEEVALALAIDGLLERSTAELSGGELQRVALGATLVGRPAVVVLDEPTSQLDPVAGDELIGLLRRLNEDQDLTVVLAEHRLERCLAAADRVVALDRGRVVFDGAPEPFLEWALEAAPSLATPGARLLAGAGLRPCPSVKQARAALRTRGLLPALADSHSEYLPAPSEQKGTQSRASRDAVALSLERVWCELPDGPAILRGVSLTLAPGERTALMGRNGAGKSTLLRHAAGLDKPTRGRVSAAGRVALLLQNPTDYLVHETVAAEGVSDAALRAVGLDPGALAARHPRDLSGGEKQRLALAIVLGDPGGGGRERGIRDPTEPPAVVCLDEPTRGMDRAVKDELARLLRGLAAAVLVATHDPEFVAAFADRVILLGDGVSIADGPAAELLAGGTYFATETARILGGAGGALLPCQGAAVIGGGVPT